VFSRNSSRVPKARRARPLGHLVHDVVELLVLGLEELVQVVELQPGDVPVEVPGLGVQDVFVGEQRVQDLGHRLPVFVGNPDVRLHVFLPVFDATRPGGGSVLPEGLMLP
jgi:hypothetical protein